MQPMFVHASTPSPVNVDFSPSSRRHHSMKSRPSLPNLASCKSSRLTAVPSLAGPDVRRMKTPGLLHRGALGMGVLAGHRGRGIGSRLLSATIEAADAMDIQRLELQVFRSNGPALHLYERIFKILPRLGIRPTQRKEVTRGNQNVATVTAHEAAAIRAELAKTRGDASSDTAPSPSVASTFFSDDVGYFYLIELEPAHDPGRFKVGFTTELEGRLQKHRCSAPFARYVKTWPCRRAWERTAIDCVTDGCERLHTEVFRSTLLESVVGRADSFFSVMPKPLSDSGDSDGECCLPRYSPA